MENHEILGCIMIFMGLVLYAHAVDVPTSLPGNFAFFIGIIIATWGTSNELLKVFFTLAVMSLTFMVIGLTYFFFKARFIDNADDR